MDENELRQTIDAMGRTIERDAKRIAALKAELADERAYAMALRAALADALAYLSDEPKCSDFIKWGKRVIAGEIK